MRPIRSDLPRLKRALFYTLVFSLAAHAYMYFTFAPSHDGLGIVSSSGEGFHQLALGRFMEAPYWFIRGRLAVPWLVGILSMLYLSGGCYFIMAALGIERRSSAVVLCGILSTNLAVTASNATYLLWADSYMLAMLLACAGVWLWERLPRWGALAAVPCFVCCMGFYQAYIDVAIGLALLLLMRRALDGEPFSALWKRALRYGLSLLAGAALYYAAVKLSLALTGVAMAAGYNGLTNLLDSDLPTLLRLVPRAYRDFFRFFADDHSYNPLPVRLCAAALGPLGLWRWIAVVRARHIRGPELAALALCAALLPLGLNFVCVLSGGMVHHLMIYGYFLIYIAVLLPFDREDYPPGGPSAFLSGRRRAFCAAISCCSTSYSPTAPISKSSCSMNHPASTPSPSWSR